MPRLLAFRCFDLPTWLKTLPQTESAEHLTNSLRHCTRRVCSAYEKSKSIGMELRQQEIQQPILESFTAGPCPIMLRTVVSLLSAWNMLPFSLRRSTGRRSRRRKSACSTTWMHGVVCLSIEKLSVGASSSTVPLQSPHGIWP